MTVRAAVRIDVAHVAPPGCRTLAADVVAPEGESRPVVLFCFPGGGMSRRYFDLAAPGYSFAEHLAGRGFVSVVVDHPGVGDSDTPDDPWSLTPETVAEVEVAAVRSVLADLRSGAIGGLAPLVPGTVVGVGHSAGAMLVVRQQVHHLYGALVLLGWTGSGLPQYLDEEELALGEDPGQLARAQVDIARRRHGAALVELPRPESSRMAGGTLAAAAREALGAAAAPLLTVVGYASMVPGNSTREAAAVDVPVFLGVGENDLAGDHHLIPSQLTGSGDVTLFVLPGAGHNHNVAPNRDVLWDRIAGWLGTPGL